MFARICSAVILSFFLLTGSAEAQVQFQPPQASFRSLFKVPIRAASSCGSARPIWSDAGRIPKAFAAVCTITPRRAWKMPTFAKPCCVASARPGYRRSSWPGCRRPSNPRSARPSPRSPRRPCNACSSRRRTSRFSAAKPPTMVMRCGAGASVDLGDRRLSLLRPQPLNAFAGAQHA
jgi:hypothetical protein